jgi:hypothetical protein
MRSPAILTVGGVRSRDVPWPSADRTHPMLDLIFLVAALAFLALSAGYAALCERL